MLASNDIKLAYALCQEISHTILQQNPLKNCILTENNAMNSRHTFAPYGHLSLQQILSTENNP